MNKKSQCFFILAVLILLLQACNFPGFSQPTETQVPPTEEPTLELPPTEIINVQHQVFPASAPDSKLFYDVESSGTAPEKRAPYGDSYDINLLERPFLQDMTYVPDLDIRSFSLSQDGEFYYVSIGLIGSDPNNTLGINYGLELDKGRDGFGDFIVIVEPPNANEWTTENVKVYADTNSNSAGISPVRSDAPFTTDGYDSLIFDGGRGEGDDPDLAWVRVDAGPNANIQFAFKKTLAGSIFMFGVLADAGLKDVAQLDYVDRFTEEEAGSPIKNKKYYPLKALYAVDNTCWEAYGFDATGYEPKICPSKVPPTKEPGQPQQPGTTPEACQPPPGGCYIWHQDTCSCEGPPDLY